MTSRAFLLILILSGAHTACGPGFVASETLNSSFSSVTPTISLTPTRAPSATPTATPTTAPSSTPTPTTSPTSTPSATPIPTATPTATPTTAPSSTPAPTVTPLPTASPTSTPAPSSTPSPTPTPRPTVSVTPTPPVTPIGGLPTHLIWTEIANTRLSNVAPNPLPAVRHTSVTGGWSGGALDTRRNRLIIWGGGHNDYSGNEIYALNIDTNTISRLNDPTPSQYVRNGCSGGDGTYADGKPVSRHTYNQLAYIPTLDSLFAFGGSMWEGGCMGRDVWLFDFSFGNLNAAGAWSRMNNVNGPSGNFGRATAYDDNSGKVFVWDDTSLRSFDPINNTWFTNNSGGQNSSNNYRIGAIDPTRRVFLGIARSPANTLFTFDISNANARGTLTRSALSNCDAISEQDGFEYDPVYQKFVIWDGGNSVTFLDPTIGRCTTLTTDNVGPIGLENGTYGRFRYSPKSNKYVVCNSVSDNCYSLQLSGRN